MLRAVSVPTPPTGVLLVNLGTPASPSTGDVRRYLREFLGDPRVLDMPAPLRWLLLNLVILPLRPRRSARAYRSIWTPGGSPLRVHGRGLRDAVAEALGDGYRVELAMRYGAPSIPHGLERLRDAGAREVRVLPLFPQYAEATTGSTLARVRECASGLPLELVELGDFHDDPGFVGAFAERARETLASFRPDHLVLSFHGLPAKQLQRTSGHAGCLADERCCAAVTDANRGCYRAQCFATARALAAALDLSPEDFTVCFQSRVGAGAWIEPYTDRTLEDLARRGLKRVAVACPAFVADCLETLEEIGLRERERWRERGGEDLVLVPCPNASPRWSEAVARMIREAGP